MASRILHIYRNSPFGRETLLQTAHFADRIGGVPYVFIPRHPQFLMYFESDVVTVGLDNSYLRSPETAPAHVKEILAEVGVRHHSLEPKDFTAPNLPDIPVDFEFMCCPRSISDLSSKVGLGYIGPRVRRIIKQASFPVLVPTSVFKPWKRVVAFYGGSKRADVALSIAAELAERAALPLMLFTQAAGKPRSFYEERLQASGRAKVLERSGTDWIFCEKGQLQEHLMKVPHDSLLVLGAYGHGLIRDFFGSFTEKVQTIMPNPLLIVGPKLADTY